MPKFTNRVLYLHRIIRKNVEIVNIALKEYVSQSKYDSFALKVLDDEFLQTLSQTHRNSFFQVIMIEEGEGHIFIDFQKHDVKAPAICFVFPQQIYSLSLSSNAKGEAVMFDHTIFCSEILATELKEYNVDLHKRVNAINYTVQNIDQFNEIIAIKEHIKRLEEPYNNIRKIEVKFLSKIIILKTIDSTASNNFKGVKDKDFELFMEFRRLIDNDFRHDRKVQNYCDRLGVSAKRLNLLCKRYVNDTALDLIHERLSLEIKKLLMYEEMPLKEIAYLLCFDSQSALNKYIGQKFGCTPSELKKKIAQ